MRLNFHTCELEESGERDNYFGNRLSCSTTKVLPNEVRSASKPKLKRVPTGSLNSGKP